MKALTLITFVVVLQVILALKSFPSIEDEMLNESKRRVVVEARPPVRVAVRPGRSLLEEPQAERSSRNVRALFFPRRFGAFGARPMFFGARGFGRSRFGRSIAELMPMPRLSRAVVVVRPPVVIARPRPPVVIRPGKRDLTSNFSTRSISLND